MRVDQFRIQPWLPLRLITRSVMATIVTGLSMGGYGTWDLVTAYPNRFAAAAPICGGGDAKKAARIKDLPVWAFHGDADETVPVENSQRMVGAVTAAGGKAKLTIHPAVGHDSWTRTYKNPALYAWLLSHTLAPGNCQHAENKEKE